MKKSFLFLIIFVCIISSLFSQQQSKVVFGLQYKPLIPTKILNVNNLELEENGLKATISPLLGYNFGAIIRWNLFNKLAVETGLSYLKRNFKMEASSGDTITESLTYGIVTYEIPIQALFYVRLGKQFYMNAASGFSLNFRASSVGSVTENRNFALVTFVKNINLAYVANLGFEYRTKKNGNFYLGASLTNPFRPLGLVEIKNLNNIRKISGNLLGNYISVDFRYFFNENKSKKKK